MVGAHPDLLLIDGNPFEDISILLDYEERLDLIMKGGVICKETMNRNAMLTNIRHRAKEG
jgi:hypothetical protein